MGWKGTRWRSLPASLLLRDGLLLPSLDPDGARLLLLRDLAPQFDRQQAVSQLGARDLDVVGELEAALKVAAGDAAIEILLVVVGVRRGMAGDQKLILLLGHIEL